MVQYYVLGSAGVAMAIGFFWMIIMKMCVACITWTVIILILLLSTALTYFIYDLGAKRAIEITDYCALDEKPCADETPTNYYQYASYVCIVLLFLLYCVIICNYKKIRIVIRIMDTAADFVTEVWSVMLVPPANMVLFLIWVAVWVPLAFYVYSRGEF